MSCKIVILADKVHISYCIVADDLEHVGPDLCNPNQNGLNILTALQTLL
uniref:Uncharacterized protein n=1 Tax=viral metagenome TaxID=1070528 RepID=A0A6C0EK12_9ZZZZ